MGTAVVAPRTRCPRSQHRDIERTRRTQRTGRNRETRARRRQQWRNGSRTARTAPASIDLLRVSEGRVGVQDRKRGDERAEDKEESGRERQGCEEVIKN